MTKKNITSIVGNESSEDLIAMVDSQDNPAGVITLITMTTQVNRPATFRQFKRQIKTERPEIYEKYKNVLGVNGEEKKKSGWFMGMRLFNFFGKNNFQKVIDELKKNNLDTMVRLLLEAKLVGHMTFSEDQKINECEMLKNNFNLQKGPAIESLNRFKWAKDICEAYDYNKGANFMQNYVHVYNMYIKNYCT